MDRVQNKPNSSVQYTPSSESFQVYLNTGIQKVPFSKHSQLEGNFLTFAVDDSNRICLSLQKYEINIDV
jgi:hypothetical protein